MHFISHMFSVIFWELFFLLYTKLLFFVCAVSLIYFCCFFFSRVTKGDRASQGWGKSLFIAKTELEYDPGREVQYLKNDCLHIRVQSVIVHV